VQFDHRLLATLTAVAVTATLSVGFGVRPPSRVRWSLAALGVTIAVQYALGVATLLLVVPPALGVIHQLNAVLVLTAACAVLHGVRQPSVRLARR
jgi:cytochrome c oxidase assembly protein subunit 15